MNRTAILDQVGTYLQQQIAFIDQELTALVSDLGNETKSSAGDKFETAREMIQQERVKLEQSKAQKILMFAALNQLKEKTPSSVVQSGSVISTNKGIFVLGLAIGKVQSDNNPVIFGLGLNSPLAKELLNKSVNDTFELSGIVYTIDHIR